MRDREKLILSWKSDPDRWTLTVDGQGETLKNFGPASPQVALQKQWRLPAWWTTRFQDVRSFLADHLEGCEASFESRGSCYTVRFGEEVWERPSEGGCATSTNSSGSRYEFVASSYQLQTYASAEACLPTAKFKELSVQVTDAKVAPRGDVTLTPCRAALHVELDVQAVTATCKRSSQSKTIPEKPRERPIPKSLPDDGFKAPALAPWRHKQKRTHRRAGPVMLPIMEE